MLEVGNYIKPSLPVVFELLKESTDTDHDMLAGCFGCTNSIELEHGTSRDRHLDLERPQQLLPEKFRHQLNIVSIFRCFCSEVYFEESEEEIYVNAIFDT